MSRDASIALVAGAIVVAIVVAAGLGAFATTSTSTTTGAQPGQPVPDPPSDSSAGVIFDLHATGGQSIFGVRLRSGTFVAQVGMIVPPECVVLDAAGNEELLTEGICASLPVQGELSGGGTTPEGLKLVFVRVEVSRPCFEALAIGDTWPAAVGACEA